jgi:glycosyltransferase involved in cell wall biosynthesis
MHHLRLGEADVQLLGNGSDHLDQVVADDAVLQRLGLVGQPFLLVVGSDTPGKNLARLLLAVAAIPESLPGLLVMVGGRNRAVFRQTKESGIRSGARVRAAGIVQDAELKALYQAATALVIPSLYEGFGLPAAEAMRLGCPVVAAAAGALPEVCGQAALVVDPYVVSELTEALVRVLTDQPLRRRMSLAGQERMAGVTWHAAASRLQLMVRQAAWA